MVKKEAVLGKKRIDIEYSGEVNTRINKQVENKINSVNEVIDSEISENKILASTGVNNMAAAKNIDTYITKQLKKSDLDITVRAVKIGIKGNNYRDIDSEEKKVDKFISRKTFSTRINTFSTKETVDIDMAILSVSNYARNNMNVTDESRSSDGDRSNEIGIAGAMRKCPDDGTSWDINVNDKCPTCGGNGHILARQALPKGTMRMRNDGSKEFDASNMNTRNISGLVRVDNTNEWLNKTVKFMGSKMQLTQRLSPGNVFGINVEETEYDGKKNYQTTGTSGIKALCGESITFGEIFQEQSFDENDEEVFTHIDSGRDIKEDGFFNIAFEIIEEPTKSEDSDKYHIVMQDALANNGITVINFWTESKALADKLTPRETDDEPITGLISGRLNNVEILGEEELDGEYEFGWKANLNISENESGIPVFLYDKDGELINIDEFSV